MTCLPATDAEPAEAPVAKPEPCGVIVLDKPGGMSSHDVINRVRRSLGVRRVGHAGTLDPMATGVLVVCVGAATRIIEYLRTDPKVYEAAVTFGIETDTQDITGNVMRRAVAEPAVAMAAPPPLPSPVKGEGKAVSERGEVRTLSLPKSRADVEAILPRFTGSILQTPPMVSAIQVGGKRLYDLARKGLDVERAPRPVTVYRLELTDFIPGTHPVARLTVECSSGTYVRTLAADMGAALGCGAVLSELRRTRCGAFGMEQAVSPDGPLKLIPIETALDTMPCLTLDEAAFANILFGRAVPLPGGERQGASGKGQEARVERREELNEGDRVLLRHGCRDYAIAVVRGNLLQPVKVLARKAER
jgi:tRNA pseudouridine55 synthase